MFSASVHADIWSSERSELTVTGGGKRKPDGEADFLIWEMSHALRDGDRVAFSFADECASSPKGQLLTAEPNSDGPQPDFFGPMVEANILKLETRPVLNSQCAWRFFLAQEPEVVAATDSHRQSISLHLLWNEMRPERMRVNLSRNSLREIVARTGGEELFLRYVGVGTQAQVIVGI